ncbi:MAG: autotransporter domain-containing protein [Rickettsiales bacterium]
MRNRFTTSTALVLNFQGVRHAALLMLTLGGLAAPMSASAQAVCGAVVSANGAGCGLQTSVNTTINSGVTISGTVDGFFDDVAAFTNDGTINATGSQGFLLGNSTLTTLTNTGTITANVQGILNQNASTIGTLNNSGTISGTGAGSRGILNQNSSTIGTITNQTGGTISGGVGIFNDGSGSRITTLTNQAGGTISGISNRDSASITTLTNAGMISGDINNTAINNSDATITTLTNSGTISGRFGILQRDAGSTITTLTNSGTISGGTGIFNDRGLITTLNNSGTIRGTADNGITNGSGSGRITTLTNSGTIEATGMSGFGVSSDETLTTLNNEAAGVISGPTGSIAINHVSGTTTINNAGTLNGNVTLGEVGNLNITGNNTAVINGDVSANTGFSGGNVAVTSGSRYTNNTNADFNVESFTIANTARLSTNGASYTVRTGALSNGFTNNGTLNLVNNTTTNIIGDYTQSAGGTLSIGASSDASFGRLSILGDATFAAGSTLAVDVIGTTGSFTNGLSDVVTTTGTLSSTTLNITDNSRLWDFESVSDSNSISFNAIQVSAIAESNAAAVGNVNRGAASALTTLTDNGANQAITNAFATLTTDAEIASAVNATVPNINNAINNTNFATLGVIQSTIADRQAGTGKSGGNGFIIADQHFWARPFGTFNNQDGKDGITGSDGQTYGITIGADGKTASGTTLGLAGTYANASQETDDGRQDATTNSYHVAAYGSHTIAPATDLIFEIGGGYNDNNSDRTINFGGLNSTAEGDYASFSGNIGAGIRHTIALAPRTFLRPEARIDYTVLYSESYSESGAGALNLNVEDQYFDELVPLVGARLDHGVSDRWNVSANAGVGYDLLNRGNSIASSFVGGGGGFAVQGIENSPFIFRTGIDTTYRADDTTSFNLAYVREDEGSDAQFQSVFLTARYAF